MSNNRQHEGRIAAQQHGVPVLFEDSDLLVVDKPAGMVVHPAKGHWEGGTLVDVLAGVAGGGEGTGRTGIVHRLDKGTSGVLVVAKNEVAYRKLQKMIADRLIERHYTALVEGKVPALSGTIDAPIGRDRSVRTLKAVGGLSARPARTHFQVDRFLTKTTLLNVRLETGRTHQIRVHLASIGHPVVGDPEYGHAGLYELDRQFLHASRLIFRHPITGGQVEVESSLPDDLERALKLAEAETV